MLGQGRATGSAALKKWTCVSICEQNIRNMEVRTQNLHHQTEDTNQHDQTENKNQHDQTEKQNQDHQTESKGLCKTLPNHCSTTSAVLHCCTCIGSRASSQGRAPITRWSVGGVTNMRATGSAFFFFIQLVRGLFCGGGWLEEAAASRRR